MSEIPFLNSITYQVIVDVLLMVMLYCIVVMMSSRRADARTFGILFLIPFMLAACTFNVMMIIGRTDMSDKAIKAQDKIDTTLETAMKRYDQARLELVDKEQELDRIVKVRVQPLLAAKDIGGLKALANRMPRNYKGSKPIHDAILELYRE